VLRLVESGVPDSPDWDGFYDGTNSGWEQFFRTLRHYLEHHAGKPRTTITITGMLPGSLDDAWANLTGASGLAIEPAAGQPFAVRLTANELLSGHVVAAKAPGSLELTIREFGDAYLAHSMAGAGGNQYVYSILSLFGKNAAEVEAIRTTWHGWLTNVLHLQAAPDETPASC
jgi:hypothetical protein